MKIIKLSLVGFIAFLCVSCSKDFLNRLPKDTISDPSYWVKSEDVKLYANTFYTLFPSYGTWDAGIFWMDNASDNMIPGAYNVRLAGQNTIQSGNSNWTFSSIRSVNYGLENYSRVTDPFQDYQNYVGELYFFRAFLYFRLVKNYGDIPWVGHTLTTESTELYSDRTSRHVVADSILSDLDQAIAYLPEKGKTLPNRLSKEAALLFKSKVALYEGTWEKYHSGTPFGVTGEDGSDFLRIAASAAKTLIDMQTVSLYNTGNPESDYQGLFNKDDLSTISEVLLWKKYDTDLSMFHNSQNYLTNGFGGNTGLSKSLIDAFLCTDGQPISTSPQYEGDATTATVTANRDNRLNQIFWIPGNLMLTGPDVHFAKPSVHLQGEYKCTSGYQLKKGANPNKRYPLNGSTVANIIFRYAEALLNYAEARAELGDLTQDDLDISINELRERAGMPAMTLATLPTDPNPEFPALSTLLNEIRRERRVELAVEGYRFDDLMRWKAHELIVQQRPIGAQFRASDFPDLVIGSGVYVDQAGYIDPYQKFSPNGWQFNPQRDYLLALPQSELALNPQLNQNPGWN